jgi:hypothetical protein
MGDGGYLKSTGTLAYRLEALTIGKHDLAGYINRRQFHLFESSAKQTGSIADFVEGVPLQIMKDDDRMQDFLLDVNYG